MEKKEVSGENTRIMLLLHGILKPLRFRIQLSPLRGDIIIIVLFALLHGERIGGGKAALLRGGRIDGGKAALLRGSGFQWPSFFLFGDEWVTELVPGKRLGM